MPSDRRVHDRFSLDVAVDLQTENNLYAGIAGDASKGGVFVATHVPPSIGTGLLVRLTLPGEAQPLEADGVVRWVRDLRASCEGSPPGCGIAWTAVSDHARTALERFTRQREPILFEP